MDSVLFLVKIAGQLLERIDLEILFDHLRTPATDNSRKASLQPGIRVEAIHSFELRMYVFSSNYTPKLL